MELEIKVSSSDVGKRHLGRLYQNVRGDVVVICNRNAHANAEHFHGTVIASTSAFYHVGQHIKNIISDCVIPFDGVINLEQL